LLLASDPRRDPKSFNVALSKEMGAKRGKQAGSFVGESRQQTIEFYRTVIQQLKPWRASAPRLPEPERGESVATDVPPDFSSPTSREPGEGQDPGVAAP